MKKLLFACAMGLMVAWLPGAGQAQQGQTFVFCFEASPEGFDPARALTFPTYNAVTDTIYNKLVGFAVDSLQIVPDLAERWEVGKDGRHFTFHLRHGVKWHTTDYFTPTRPFNSDDVVLSLDRLRDKDHPFNLAYGWSEYAYTRTYTANIERIEKLDDYTVRITLKKADASFLGSLAMPSSVIISAEYAANLRKAGRLPDINVAPIGTGPFVLRRYDKDTQIRFDANPDYYDGRAKFDHLVYVITKDSAVRLQKLKAGECQLSISPKPQEIAAIKADPNLKLAQTPGVSTGFIAFNTSKKPLDNVDVRRALSLAINKKAIFDSVFQGSAIPANTLLTPGMIGFDPSVPGYGYDPEQARALLAKAGYPQGFEIELWAMPISRNYNPDARKFSEMVQADWAKIGVRTRIVSYEWGEYIKRASAGEHQAITLGWLSDNGDPENLLTPLLACASRGLGLSRWCNPRFDALLERGREEMDLSRRAAIYREIQQLLQREVPILPISYGIVSQPMRKEVEGYHVTALNRTYLQGVELRSSHN